MSRLVALLARYRRVWAVVEVAAIVALLAAGCAPDPKAQDAAVDLALAGACGDAVAKAEADAPTCKEAERRVNADPNCQRLRPGGSYSLDCKEDRK